ncbi:MAG: hypothetical protein R3F05_04075 [Planctomycetota bacterium]|nr:hypothetical protein [Planctomycetota bacterium]
MRASLACSLALAACLFASPSARAEDPAPTPQQALVAARADSVVSVKMTLQVSFTIRGTAQENESNQTTTGIVVDSRGLIMLPAELFSPNLNSRMRSMIDDLKITPSSIRVVFPGDPKEYPAILGAKDSKLGLAFVLIRDLEGREAKALDLSKRATPHVGDTLYGVTRLSQDFDHAPLCSAASVIAEITRPRACWAMDDAGRYIAEPLYTLDGAVAGVMVRQEGVGEDADTQNCLLPLDIVESTIGRSLKAAERALEDVLAAEAEAAESGEGEKPEAPAEEPADKPADETEGDETK